MANERMSDWANSEWRIANNGWATLRVDVPASERVSEPPNRGPAAAPTRPLADSPIRYSPFAIR
jgi:hypothetical protein